MNSEDFYEGQIVEVTAEYRTVMPMKFTWGNGVGTIVGFEIDEDKTRIVFIEWADGFGSTMHPMHLQPSTEKMLFKAKLMN